MFRQLVLLSPFPDLLEIATSVLRVEIDEWLWGVWVEPDLAEDAHVDGAHELLPENVEAVCCLLSFYCIMSWCRNTY